MSSIPRWQKCLENALAEYPKAVVIQLATTSVDRTGISLQPETTPIPHVRTHIFRSFITPSKSPSLPLVLTSTDIRTPKITQMITNPHVELAWWIEGTQEQYRISGIANVIPRPDHTFYKNFVYSAEHASPGTGLHALIEQDKIDWEAKRLEVFKKMSPNMKATWARPAAPGSPLVDDPKSWPERIDDPTDGDSEEEKENRKNWEIAYGNFALVVIDPVEVDYLEMAIRPNRRWRFWKHNRDWKEQAIVP